MTLRNEDDIDLLEHRANRDDRQPNVPCCEQTFDAPGLRKILCPVRDELLGIDVGPAGLDIHLEAFFGKISLFFGHIVTGELRLMQPLQLQRYSVGRLCLHVIVHLG